MTDENSRRRFLSQSALGAAAGLFAVPAGAIVTDPAPFTSSSTLALNVHNFGARADGSTDDTAAIQRALDVAGKAGGGIVELPTGHYAVKGTLQVPGGVLLQGSFRVPPCSRHDHSPHLHGTVLYAFAGRGKPEAPPFILLNGNMAAVQGVIITYPEWKRTDVPPVPYPPAIAALQNTENVSVLDCCLLNTYEAIHLQSSSRHLIRNVYAYPHYRGLYIDNCTDIGRVENCHFWPFGTTYYPDDPFSKWVNLNGVAFEFARTDWQYVFNTFCFGYGVGYKFSQSKAGACNGNFLGIGSDSCERDILVEQAQPYGLLITNGEFVGRWTSKHATCIEILEGAASKLSLTNCSFWGPIHRIVWQKSKQMQFTANACHFVDWTDNAIQIDAGRAIIQGCTFMQDRKAITVGPNATSVLITTNQAPGGLKVDNQAGPRTQMGFNEQA